MEFIINFPDNESWQHYALKIAAWKWLGQRCSLVGLETSGFVHTRCDVSGLRVFWDKYETEVGTDNWTSTRKVFTTDIDNLVIRRVEAKASRSDFAREFGNFSEENQEKELLNEDVGNSDVKHYSYVIIPEGMIDLDDVPTHYGILEVPLEEGRLPVGDVNCLRNPRPMYDQSNRNKEEIYTKWTSSIGWQNSSTLPGRIRLRSDQKE